MQELSTKYDPSSFESRWYAFWQEQGLFHSEPDDREPFTVVIPPPNVTGVLHMGHMLNNTLQDVLVRRARMMGRNACWVPGTDHASIATEAKVVEMLRKRGIDKSTLTRDEFLAHAWEWKEKHGGIILEQLKRLGASCDWARTAFTMDEARSESVLKVFVDLYRKGLIYKGVRMVNWDPQAQTALSDEEVIYREEQGHLYYLRYKLVGSSEYLLVATTRPETIMGDTAVCVNPNDTRYAHLKGQRVVVPLVGREVPIIQDDYVDLEFGTGALKITPAHDINDFKIGERFSLPTIDVFNDDGTLSEAAGMYVGLDRFEVRRRIVADLEQAGLLDHVEEYTHSIGHSERTDAVIEPKLSTQWFLKMDEMAKPALDAVLQGQVELIPQRFVGTYRHWMEGVHDWCISRQLWWGHRIPAWYLPDGRLVVAETEDEALAQARKLMGDDALPLSALRQDEDVLDTWFSSWLWPISVFDGISHPDNPEINYYYPTSALVTAPEIIFFWVARMVMAGCEYRHTPPFRHVYLTGIVRDQQRRKMSKSLGNSPDPISLMEKYGADGVRMGMLLCSSAGNDLLFDETLLEQGRNFCNKIWNALRLVKGWTVDEQRKPEARHVRALDLFEARMMKVLAEVDRMFEQYRISEALMELYRLFWDDFSAWALEMVKPARGEAMSGQIYSRVQTLFEALLATLHPFMPFITEELWHHLGGDERLGKSLMVEAWPKGGEPSAELLAEYEELKSVVSNVRAIRQSKGIGMREPLRLLHRGKTLLSPEGTELVRHLAHIDAVELCDAPGADATTFLVGNCEYFVPLTGMVDADEERRRIQKDLEYMEGFKAIVLKKLQNERFLASAPETVIESERKKLSDAEAKIAALRNQLGL